MTHHNEKPTTTALYDDREILVRLVFLLQIVFRDSVLPLFFDPIIVSLDSRVQKCISKYFVVCMYVVLVYPASGGAENQRQWFLAVVCTFWLTIPNFFFFLVEKRFGRISFDRFYCTRVETGTVLESKVEWISLQVKSHDADGRLCCFRTNSPFDRRFRTPFQTDQSGIRATNPTPLTNKSTSHVSKMKMTHQEMRINI